MFDHKCLGELCNRLHNRSSSVQLIVCDGELLPLPTCAGGLRIDVTCPVLSDQS